MAAQALFSNGGFRVRDGDVTVGFVWVEPAPGGGQLQRWVLTKALGKGLPDEQTVSTFTFDRWGGNLTLEDWKAASRRQLPRRLTNTRWGDNPVVDGLWPRTRSFYIVAQSRPVEPAIKQGSVSLPSVQPIYPRRDAVATIMARRLGVKTAGHTAPEDKMTSVTLAGSASLKRPPHGVSFESQMPPGKIPQIVIPLIGLYQTSLLVPSKLVGLGGAGPLRGDSSDYFEAEEAFLLKPEFRRVGTLGFRSRWDSNVTVERPILTLSDLRSYIEATWTSGSRYEATGCNYYEGDEPPEAEFV